MRVLEMSALEIALRLTALAIGLWLVVYFLRMDIRALRDWDIPDARSCFRLSGVPIGAGIALIMAALGLFEWLAR